MKPVESRNQNEKALLKMEEEKVWHCLTNEEVNRFSNEIKVCTSAKTGINNPLHFIIKDDFKNIVEKSKTKRLIDLGCSNSCTRFFDDKPDRDFFMSMVGDETGLSKAGIHEYIGVDLGKEGTDWKEADPKETFEKEGLKYKIINEEILKALHSFPDDYGNATIFGIDESGGVIRNAKNWAMGVISELKRVVPENGFIYTDFGVLGDIFEKLAGVYLRGQSKDYRVKKDDKFFPKFASEKRGFVVDAPNIGFRIYLDLEWNESWTIEGWMTRMIVVNVKKNREK